MKIAVLLTASLVMLITGAALAIAGPNGASDTAQAGVEKASQTAKPSHKAKTGNSRHDSVALVKQASKNVSTPPEKRILFFMNPNGHPCQMQLSILDGMKDKLQGLAAITYIKTTEAADQQTFYTYGIRGLPSLIILDGSGKEIKRFTPGIQDEENILAALNGQKN